MNMPPRKKKWLKAKKALGEYITYLLPMKEVYEMTNETNYNPDMETISNWIIMNYTVDNREVFCFAPWRFCWSSDRTLFMRKAVRIKTIVQGPGEPVIEYFYFRPSHYTKWLLEQS